MLIEFLVRVSGDWFANDSVRLSALSVVVCGSSSA